MSRRESGSNRWYNVRASASWPASTNRNNSTHSAGATFATPETQPAAPAAKPSSAQSSPPTRISSVPRPISAAIRRASPLHSLTATTPGTSAAIAPITSGARSTPDAPGLLYSMIGSAPDASSTAR